jgi:nucleoside-diphosphate-sugar epimerase
MNVFVTGASGFIGTHVVRLLQQAGHTVTPLQGNLATASNYPPWSFDAVIHLASLIPHRGTYSNAHFAQVNVTGTRQLLAWCGGAHFVYVSTMDVERAQLSDYARTKLEAEACVREHRSHCVVRLPSIFGPGQRQQSKLIPRLLRAAVLGEPVPTLTNEARPCLYVTEAAEAVCAGLGQRGLVPVAGKLLHNLELARLIDASTRGEPWECYPEADRPWLVQFRACADWLRRDEIAFKSGGSRGPAK